jgi:uncharacterized membrane-anchored protein
MSGVVICMEANQITMQDSKQQLVANGQDAINLATRERRMKEEADLDVVFALADFLAQHLREQHEMVIVDPDQIAVLDFSRDSSGK